MGVIYSIMNPKGRLYVGKTYDLRKRINCHKWASKKGSTIILHNSIKKYGWDNHFLQVIEEIPDEMLNEREMFWILKMKTYCYENPMGMNMTLGGDGQRSTWMHDIERREKASINFSGSKNPFYGKKQSKEAKDIISKKASKRNKEQGRIVPKWGAEKSYEQSRKAIIVYDINGNFLNEFISIAETARHFNINTGDIWAVLTKNQVHAAEMFFFYKTENYPLNIDVSAIKIRKVNRPILSLDKNKKTIKEYDAAKDASKDLFIPVTTISRAAQYNKGKPIRTGHIFVYKDEYENQLSNQLN